MSDYRQDPLAGEEDLQELFASAGRRPEVPPEDLAAIQAAARREWEEVVAAGRTRSRFVPLALAASLLLALTVFWWRRTEAPPPAPPPVATVELVKDGSLATKVGDALAPGAPLATGEDGRVALRLAGGESVRLDAGTRVRLVSGTRLDLEAGAVYVDSGRPAGGGALEIRTSLGSVREVGTRFEVRLESGGEVALRVRVREGAVSLLRRGGAEPVAAGEELRLRRDGAVSRGTVAPYGPAWDWVTAAAPGLDLDGLTLRRYLDWVSRETGKRIRYEDEALAGQAAEIRLHGSTTGMTPEESVSVVLPGSGLGYRIAGGTLLVERIRAPR